MSSLLSCHFAYEIWPYRHPKHFDPEDGSSIFLPNIDVPLPDYVVSVTTQESTIIILFAVMRRFKICHT
jgi:hypothetical protein